MTWRLETTASAVTRAIAPRHRAAWRYRRRTREKRPDSSSDLGLYKVTMDISFPRRVLILAAAMVTALWAPLGAQQQPAEPPNVLPTVKALKCRFPAATTATWKNGEVVAQTKTQEMLFTISEIDVQDGTAEFLGTAGRSYVTAVLSGWSIYFVES